MHDVVRAELEATFGELLDMRSISGGCISPSYRVVVGADEMLFVKTARQDWPPDAFDAEAHSLEQLRSAAERTVSGIVVPAVRGVAETWLALEWLEPSSARADDWAMLGRGLARLHREPAQRYGWARDNYIGPLPQHNGWETAWPSFWRERRLVPQLENARLQLDAATLHAFDRLLDELDERLAIADDDGASLLHGDLWNGNVHISTAGAAVIDPSCYFGHREVDLAMAALFGGFPRDFFDAYTSEWPLLDGASARIPIYQLYYLLVHVVLFGGAYVGSTSSTLRQILH